MRAVIEFEILYNADTVDLESYDTLEDIERETISGLASGNWTIKSNDEVSKEQMKELLLKQGSAPEFLIDEED